MGDDGLGEEREGDRGEGDRGEGDRGEGDRGEEGDVDVGESGGCTPEDELASGEDEGDRLFFAFLALVVRRPGERGVDRTFDKGESVLRGTKG